LAGRAAHDSLEGKAEGAFGRVAERQGNFRDRVEGISEPVACAQHAPAGQVFHGGSAHLLFEPEREGGSRHAGEFGQFLQCPASSRGFVHGRDRGAQLRIGQGEDPADAVFGVAGCDPVGDMEPQRLDEHHLGEVQTQEETAGLRLAKHAHHAFEIPAHRRAVGFVADVDDRGQQAQQNTGMFAAEGEIGAEPQTRAAAIPGEDATVEGRSQNGFQIEGRHGQIAGQAVRTPIRHHDAIARFETHRFAVAFHR